MQKERIKDYSVKIKNYLSKSQNRPLTFAYDKNGTKVSKIQRSIDNSSYKQQKTHFKGVASIFIQKENSLDLGDENARDIVKECLNKTGN